MRRYRTNSDTFLSFQYDISEKSTYTYHIAYGYQPVACTHSLH